jgi:L-seryl-tRNA(Ser) seleniumtransferase
MTRKLLSQIPQVEKILQREDVHPLLERYGKLAVTQTVREILSLWRSGVLTGKTSEKALLKGLDRIGATLESRLSKVLYGSTKTVINGAGVIIHTNLGRACLDEALMDRLKSSAASFTNLEYDLQKGKRGKRGKGLEVLLSLLFPGYSSHVVNNNAAAVLLLLNTMAFRKEVIVSRGELVEIGGSFRIPDIMAKSGARLREVGTTNKTRLSDYEKAINDRTALILKVHQSNFMIVGFTEEVSSKELSSLTKKYHLPLLVDQGSGCIVDLKKYGIKNEPTVQQILHEGADVACFSGDKLLGGPQAGIIIGKEALIKKVKKNPLSRTLRIDKITNALMESTLISFVKGKEFDEIPVLRMLAMNQKDISKRAKNFMKQASGELKEFQFELHDDFSTIGGGSAPTKTLPTKLLAVSYQDLTVGQLEQALRLGDPPVIGRIKEDRYLLDFRTVLPEQEESLFQALKNLEK